MIDFRLYVLLRLTTTMHSAVELVSTTKALKINQTVKEAPGDGKYSQMEMEKRNFHGIDSTSEGLNRACFQ